MGPLRKNILFYSVAMLFFLLIVGCGHRQPNTVIAEEIDEESDVCDTLSSFQALPDAPLITTHEANRSNPSYTGYTPGWEERLSNAYADSLHRTLKTLILYDPWAASETAEAFRNDIYPQTAPVLLIIKWPLQYRPDNYWKQHSYDSAVKITSFESHFSRQYECHFGPSCLKSILEASYPIELKDTTSFRPIIRITDMEKGSLYSPLFECFYRGKPFLICSFDVDTLKTTEAGSYLWDIIRNYTYSSYFRVLLQSNTIEMNPKTWFETLAPSFNI